MRDLVLEPKDIPVVILTGAGISKESGLDTFRDADGIWSKVRVEDVATPEAFARDPERVHAFYNMRRALVRDKDVQPNAAHFALARLEQHWPGPVHIVTQNVDTLHEKAGTENLIHMHGVHAQARCNACGHVTEWEGDMSTSDVCDACGTLGSMRPNVVWFGEMPLQMERIQELLIETRLFLSIGTSGNVYPAAGFVSLVKQVGEAHTIELNLERSVGADQFHDGRYGPATEVVPTFVEDLLAAV